MLYSQWLIPRWFYHTSLRPAMNPHTLTLIVWTYVHVYLYKHTFTAPKQMVLGDRLPVSSSIVRRNEYLPVSNGLSDSL